MGRKRDKRNGPPMPEVVAPTNDQAENYEGDDEGRDEESPPPKSQSPVTPKAKKGEEKDGEKDEKKSTSTNSKKKKGKSKKEEDEFEVEQIVGMEVNLRWRCPVRFLVRWVGYGEKDDTWVSVDNLCCENFVKDFLQISCRISEYEKAMESKRANVDANAASFEGYKESLRGRYKVNYNDDPEEEDEEVMRYSATRTRKTNAPDLYDPSAAGNKRLSKPKKPVAKSSSTTTASSYGVSRALARAQQAGREYEVVMIVDHRVKGRFTEYKVRWKGLNSSHDSWVPEGNLTCPKLIANYNENVSQVPEQEYEVAAIIDSREQKGKISYKVHWKGFSAKFDSWLPKEEMSCTEMIDKFEAALEKLNKKEDWVVSKIKSKRVRNGIVEFLVGWEGFDYKYDTWEPEDNLQGCKDKLDDYSTTNANTPAKQQKRKQSPVIEESEPTKKEKESEPTKKEKESEPTKKEKESELTKKEKESELTKKEKESELTKKEKESELTKKESDQEEEIIVKSSKKKRKRTASSSPAPSKASSSEPRRRRITLPVSYEEPDDGGSD